MKTLAATLENTRRMNLVLTAVFLAVQGLQLVLLPIWLLPGSPTWGWLLLLPVLLSNSWWAFIHEAIHGVLFPGKSANRLAGRVNAILFGAPFELLRRGHLLHHAASRTERERSEVYVPGRDHRLLFAIGYYLRLFGGLYCLEVVGGLVLLLPCALLHALACRLGNEHNVIESLAGRILEPITLRAARLDVTLVLGVYALAFALYGEYAWMLALSLLGRGFLISAVDNVFHYGTPLDQPRYAHNLALPDWASRLIFHFNLHGAHHQRPGLAWWQLPDYHCKRGLGFQGKWLPALLAQLKGPIPEPRLRAC
ncbi:MAG: fatty acid desaturase [Candidatus Competibacteraceae bacterium]